MALTDAPVVVIFGHAGHGKDTLANMLAHKLRALGCGVRRLAFAEPIKEVANHLLGMPWAVSHGTLDDKNTWTRWGKTAREWLQWLGTEVGRSIHADIWVERIADIIKAADPYDIAIISDGRFHNERTKLGPLCQRSIFAIRIYRPDIPTDLRHQSERELTEMKDVNWGWTVANRFDLRSPDDKDHPLQQAADEIVEELLHQHPSITFNLPVRPKGL